MKPLLSASLVWLLASPAHAGGKVAGLSEQDAAGRWRSTSETTEAVRIRGSDETPLTKGMELLDGDLVRTTDARVDIKLDDGGTLHVREATEATVQPRSVLQSLGDVYYRVRGAFEVRYGTVEAVVEGTGFQVVGDGAGTVTVRVSNGVVKVANVGSEVTVRKKESVVVPADGPPGAVERWARSERMPTLQETFLLARPKLVVGGLGGGGLVGDGPAVGGKGFARIALIPGFDAQVGAGVTNNGSGDTRVPVTGDVGLALGGFGVAARLSSTLELCECPGPDEGGFRALHLGGGGVGRGRIPLGRATSLEGEVEVAWAGGLNATGWFGVGVAL